MTIPRRVVVIGCGVSATFIVLAAAGLWFGNTKSLNFPYEARGAPGEALEIDIDGKCPPNRNIVYRQSGLGRWQQTHVNGRPDVIHWYELGNRSYDEELDCRSGPWSVSIPMDVTSSPIAICDLGSRCVKVDIDWPAQ